MAAFLVLSGCVATPDEGSPEASDDGTTPTSSPVASGQPTPSTTGQPTPSGSMEPTGLPTFNLTVNVTGDLVAGEGFQAVFTTDLPTEVAQQASWVINAFAGAIVDGAPPTGDALETWTGNDVTMPANLSLTPEGVYTLAVEVSAPEYDPATALVEVTIAGVPDDPCIGAAVQAGVADGDLITPNVDGMLGTFTYDVAVQPCQTKVTFAWDYLPSCFDMDFYIDRPDGSEAGRAAGFTYPEPSVAIADVPYLAEGTWVLTVIPFATVACDFSFTATFG